MGGSVPRARGETTSARRNEAADADGVCDDDVLATHAFRFGELFSNGPELSHNVNLLRRDTLNLYSNPHLVVLSVRQLHLDYGYTYKAHLWLHSMSGSPGMRETLDGIQGKGDPGWDPFVVQDFLPFPKLDKDRDKYPPLNFLK